VRKLFVTTLLLLCGGMPGCGSGSEGKSSAPAPVFQNQIFRQTGDLSAAASGPETGTPTFSWPATNYKHVVCAVFRSPIEVRQNEITNIDQIVWLWHSGLTRGREGNVTYSSGTVSLDETDTGPPAGPLASGTYYWAVWALDDGGTPVLSSVEYNFAVP
jgi:hypothetical protein